MRTVHDWDEHGPRTKLITYGPITHFMTHDLNSLYPAVCLSACNDVAVHGVAAPGGGYGGGEGGTVKVVVVKVVVAKVLDSISTVSREYVVSAVCKKQLTTCLVSASALRRSSELYCHISLDTRSDACRAMINWVAPAHRLASARVIHSTILGFC